jgi:putative glutathione S-transferase
LFTTLLRFDPVYHTHLATWRLVDPALWAYTRRLYQHPAVAPTVNFDHIKGHYFQSHRWINPTGIVPKGPIVDFDVPVR